MRIEVQVDAPAPRRVVRAREAIPVERIEAVAGGLADSPLKSELERIARDQRKRRSKT